MRRVLIIASSSPHHGEWHQLVEVLSEEKQKHESTDDREADDE